MSRNVILINANALQPRVYPLALDYLVPALEDSGLTPHILDLAIEGNSWRKQLADTLADTEPVAVSITMRNLCTTVMADAVDRQPIQFAGEVVDAVKTHCNAAIILGGGGFSIDPVNILERLDCSYGIVGEGERALPALVTALLTSTDPATVSNLVFRRNGNCVATAVEPLDLSRPGEIRRRAPDADAYLKRGSETVDAWLNIETSRGCDRSCIYCVEPHIKGNTVRHRCTDDVIAEMQQLVEYGADRIYMCDSEFNLCAERAVDLCTAMEERNIGQSLTWGCYCSPVPFSDRLANAMRNAGCRLVSLDATHGNDKMLCALGKGFTTDDTRRASAALRRAKVPFRATMLLGGPGETTETIEDAVRFAQELDCFVEINFGVRVFRNTSLWQTAREATAAADLYRVTPGAQDFLEPVFFVSHTLPKDTVSRLHMLVDGNPQINLTAAHFPSGSLARVGKKRRQKHSDSTRFMLSPRAVVSDQTVFVDSHRLVVSGHGQQLFSLLARGAQTAEMCEAIRDDFDGLPDELLKEQLHRTLSDLEEKGAVQTEDCAADATNRSCTE